ncbi:MAG: molybdopterin-binding protein [Nitrospiraceae bacterium]|nr:molybdopterin-binding protein [Nitrospiraceae bacterium]
MLTIPVEQAVGAVLAHDVTEIRKDAFKGAAFRKGHVIRSEDVCHLQRLGKDRVFVMTIGADEMHEDDAALALAKALIGEGVAIKGAPREGKITLVAERDGLFSVDHDALLAFNMLGDVMCATLHTNTVVTKGREVAGTRAIPLVVKKSVVEEAVKIAKQVQSSKFKVQRSGVFEVKEIRKPRAGVVITGNEVYHGRIKDAFAPIIAKKIAAVGGEVVGTFYAPDDEKMIEERLRELLASGADLLITTGGMSVDPDDVTRFAVRNLGASDLVYGSAVLPGAMVLVGYIEGRHGDAETRRHGEKTSEGGVVSPRRRVAVSAVPILGIPACGMYHSTTVFDLILPRVLAGERIGRRELAELGHGGLCLHCKECRYPVCPFGK